MENDSRRSYTNKTLSVRYPLYEILTTNTRLIYQLLQQEKVGWGL